MTDPPSTAADVRLAARVRAAIAYSGLRTADVVDRLGDTLSEATLRRIASPARARGATLDELWAIADACGVPRSWLERGEWIEPPLEGEPEPVSSPLGEGPIDERLALVERYLGALLAAEQQRGRSLGTPARSPVDALRLPAPSKRRAKRSA